jgi:TonB family protein
MTEDELKRQLAGKQLYLRGGYLGDSLNFDEHGHIVGHPAQGSYTLSVIQLDHVRLTKHKVEFEGIRYGLHFNEQLAYEDSEKAYDKVRITPNKKVVKVTIDREIVVSPKKKKEKDAAKDKAKQVKPAVPGTAPASTAAPAAPPASTPGQPVQAVAASTAVAPALAAASTPAPGSNAIAPGAAEPGELSEADQLKASIAATPEAERPADPNSVTITTSQAHANSLLRTAIDAVFAQGLDDRMMASMPDFWKLYYQSVAAKADYKPADPAVLRQNMVDQKARLLTSFEPGSNDFAQAAGVAGMSLYHTVIGPDGKPGEIAVARPIGFGLDENAVAAIRKAKFSPAMKNGQPVPVMLDLVVQFRIFSGLTNRTTQPANSTPGDTSAAADKAPDKPAPPLPGPYSIPHP